MVASPSSGFGGGHLRFVFPGPQGTVDNRSKTGVWMRKPHTRTKRRHFELRRLCTGPKGEVERMVRWVFDILAPSHPLEGDGDEASMTNRF